MKRILIAIRKITMLTVDEWEENNIDLGDEIFEPVFENWLDTIYGPFRKLAAYKGTKSGQLLHPDFCEVLEFVL